MAKASLADDDIFGGTLDKPKELKKRGRQDDGTWITSTGEILPAKNRNRRTAYEEPEIAQDQGHEEIVESPNGGLSFLSIRMSAVEHRAAKFPERKRLKCFYRVTEVYAGKPRSYYSYDELEQLRRGEMVR